MFLFKLKDKTDELEQLWGEVGKAKHEFIELQAYVNAHSEAKEGLGWGFYSRGVNSCYPCE